MALLNSDTANLLAIVTMFGWGISNGLMKIPTLRMGPPKAIRLRQMVMLCILCGYLIINPPPSFGDSYWLLFSIALGFLGYVPFLFYCHGLSIGSIGVVNAIGNSFPVVTLILSYYFLNSPISHGALIGIALTSSGVLLLSLAKKRLQALNTEAELDEPNLHLKAVIYALLACLLWGVFYTIVPIPNKQLDPLPFLACLQFGTFISSHLHSTMQNKKQNLPKKTLHFAILSGIFAVTGSICFYNALRHGNPAIITAIAGSSPLVVAIYGKLIYNENISKREVFGIVTTVLGVLALSVPF